MCVPGSKPGARVFCATSSSIFLNDLVVTIEAHSVAFIKSEVSERNARALTVCILNITNESTLYEQLQNAKRA